MKNGYLNSVYVNLIEHRDYLPVRDETGQIVLHRGEMRLQKSSREGLHVVYLIDADRLSVQDIAHMLEKSRRALEEFEDNRPVLLFYTFVFDDMPGQDVLRAISSGCFGWLEGRKFITCFTVNLAGKRVERYFKVNVGTDRIDRFLKAALAEDTYRYEIMPDINEIIQKKEKEFRLEYAAKTPALTYILIFINIAVWLAMNLYSRMEFVDINSLLHRYGAKDNYLITASEYWRLLTPVFLHANLPHLLFNSYALYALGPLVEKLYGHYKFFIIYFLAGFTGNIASFIFSPSWSVGASGAIFGMFGAMLYYGIEKPKAFKRYFGYAVIANLVINLAFGFTVPQIDNFAHLGGLAGGFMASAVVRVKDDGKKSMYRYAALIITVVIIVLGLHYGFNRG